MKVQAYLSFEGRCEEAIEFYKKAVGAQVETLTRFAESPDQSMIPPGAEQKVMHSELRIGETNIFATDGMCAGAAGFKGASIALIGLTEDEARRYYEALSEGGQAGMPLSRTFFSPAFGMLTDKFGVPWMVVAEDQA